MFGLDLDKWQKKLTNPKMLREVNSNFRSMKCLNIMVNLILRQAVSIASQ